MSDVSAAEKPRRRISIARHPGVYYRELPGGRRRYEISYSDSEGRRRWQVVDGGLEQADAELAEVKQRKRKGERVAPTKATLAEVAEQWLASQTQLRPGTRERYEIGLRAHVLPRLGRLRIPDVSEEHVAHVVSRMQQGFEVARDERGRLIERKRIRALRDKRGRRVGVVELGPFSGWTIRASLTPLSLVFDYAIRRGLAARNPVARLERRERPKLTRRDMRILDRDEIERLLGKAPERYQTLLATAVFTGTRLGELLGLTWADVDFDREVVRICRQVDRKGRKVDPKTPQAVRSIVLMPELGAALKAHWLAAEYKKPDDFVFASGRGTALQARNVTQRVLRRAVQLAELDVQAKPRLRFHDLRHCFASLLIAQGADPVFVSRQLGHANPSITLTVYSHLFDSARHAAQHRALLSASFGTILETTIGEQRGNEALPPVAADGGKVVALQAGRG